MNPTPRIKRLERPSFRGAVLAACLALFLSPAASLHARNPEGEVPGKAAFRAINVIGDSLSDTGRVFAVSGFPPPPYFNGRLSNGPLWVEYLAPELGLNYDPLDNFSWAGAMTGLGNVYPGLPGMLRELDEYLASLGPKLRADKQALYVIFGGANDFFRILGAEHAAHSEVIPEAVANLIAIVSQLHAVGAEHILVVDLPNIGVTPRVQLADALAPGTAAQVTALCRLFNTLLNNALDVLGFDVIRVSAFQLLTAAFNTPAAFGFTNVTDQWIMNLASNESYLFVDEIHVTTRMHAVLAAAMFEAIADAYERGSNWKGANGFFSSRRRRPRKHRGAVSCPARPQMAL